MYLLDSNVLISAKNAHYGFDFVPAFWDWIEDAHGRGLVFTVSAVGQEIKGGGDELSEWAKRRPGSFFREPDSQAVEYLRKLGDWASSQNFTQAAISTFLAAADFYLVGQARALGYTVVTHEKSEPQATKVIKIPDACIALGVNYIQPWRMLREDNARFICGAPLG